MLQTSLKKTTFLYYSCMYFCVFTYHIISNISKLNYQTNKLYRRPDQNLKTKMNINTDNSPKKKNWGEINNNKKEWILGAACSRNLLIAPNTKLSISKEMERTKISCPSAILSWQIPKGEHFWRLIIRKEKKREQMMYKQQPSDPN